MNQQELKIVLRAVDAASDELDKVRGKINDLTGSTETASRRQPPAWGRVQTAVAGVAAVGVSAALALAAITGELSRSVEAANRYQAAVIGLSSVARGLGHSVDQARAAAISLARDGLMSVGEAAAGLKNLLASGFSLPEAIRLMESLKDKAAFNRQSFYQFGAAVVATTEGIKNGNSVLADAVGTTTNLSVMAKEAGVSVDQMGSIAQNAAYRQAILNGFIKDAGLNAGDAARLTETFSGKQAMLSTQTEILRARIGEALQPVLLRLLEAVTPVIEKVTRWIEENPRLTATIIAASVAFVAVIAVLGSVAAAVGVVVLAFGGMVAAVGGAIAAVVAAVVGLAVAVAINWDRIRQTIAQLPGWVRAAASEAGQALLGMLGPIGAVISNLDRLVGFFGRVRDAARNLGGGDIGGALKSLKIPGFATGVQNFRGGLAVVGERGPELVRLPAGSDVIPNDQLDKSFAGVTINQTNHIYHQADLDLANRELGWRLRVA